MLCEWQGSIAVLLSVHILPLHLLSMGLTVHHFIP